jgi:hypothetical protein
MGGNLSRGLVMQVGIKSGIVVVANGRKRWLLRAVVPTLVVVHLLCSCTSTESPNTGLGTASDVTAAADASDAGADAPVRQAKPDEIVYVRVAAIPWPAAEANWCHKPADFAPGTKPWACAPDWVVQCCHWNRPAPVTPKQLCEVVYCEDTAGGWRQMNAQGQHWSDPTCECAAMGPQPRLQCNKDQPALANWTIAKCNVP